MKEKLVPRFALIFAYFFIDFWMKISKAGGFSFQILFERGIFFLAVMLSVYWLTKKELQKENIVIASSPAGKK